MSRTSNPAPAIERGIPAPIPPARTKWIFLDKMEVGESAIVNWPMNQVQSALAYHRGRHPGRGYTARTIAPGSIRIWRIA